MTKVWIVLEGVDYEGYSKPEGVFSSKEKAEEIAAKCREEHMGYYVDVLEYEIDVEPEYD